MACCCFSLLPNNSQGRCSSLFFNIWDKNSSNTVSFLATYLPWENRQHFVMPALVSQQNDIGETSREIPYWWCATTQIWLLSASDWLEICFIHYCNQIAVSVIMMSQLFQVNRSCNIRRQKWETNLSAVV